MALGIANGSITGITASTQLDDEHNASKARLNGLSAWVPSGTDTQPWLQVDLTRVVEITKVSTQGFFVGGVARYITSYILLFGDDGVNFQEYKENSKTKVTWISYSTTKR